MWVPPKVSRELRDATRKRDAGVLEQIVRKGQIDEFNKALKQIDERLELIWAPPDVTTPGLKPGRYHVMRHSPFAPLTLIPIEGPEGEYLEPNSKVFDQLREADLWNEEANRDRKRREEETERQKQKAQRVEREEINAELHDRLKVANNGSIHVSKLPYKEKT